MPAGNSQGSGWGFLRNAPLLLEGSFPVLHDRDGRVIAAIQWPGDENALSVAADVPLNAISHRSDKQELGHRGLSRIAGNCDHCAHDFGLPSNKEKFLAVCPPDREVS